MSNNSKLRILLADDGEFEQTVISSKLRELGYEVSIAGDGEEALKLLKSDHFDLLILDIIMPKKDGFELLLQRSGDPELSKVPVIILSNLGQENDIKRAVQLGATDYLVKKEDILIELSIKIKNVLNSKD